MKRMKVTGKELALLCGMAALGTLTFPLGAAARTVDSVTATAGSTAEIVYSGETLTVTNGVESIGNNATGIRAVDDTEVAIGKDIYVHGANSQYNNSMAFTVTAASRSGLGQISLSNQMPVPNGYAEFTSMAVMAAAFRQRPISR
ncbi:hypothetical protein [Phascolarctobacterium faecium]|uniref:hypothetical protein n=1 Tax=Phascolarctobacterium faecium TaxID=33025 RepID=UPI003FF080FF